MTIEQLIDQTRTDNGLSNRALAHRLNIGESTLRSLVKGTRRPGTKVLGAMAREFPEHRDAILSIFLSINKH